MIGGCHVRNSDQPTQADTKIDWADCGDGLRCAKVPVPLDWARSDGETITLSVIMHPASKPDPAVRHSYDPNTA